MSDSTRTWHYWKLYAPKAGQLSAVVTDVVAPLVHARAGSWDRWFFLRYADAAGPHIRLRALVSEGEADALEETRRVVLDSLRQVQRREESASLAPPPSALPWEAPEGPARIVTDLYEPEHEKWGKGFALESAHALFQISSELSLDLIPWTQSNAGRKLAVAITLLEACLEPLELAIDQRTSFLGTHYEWWSGGSSPYRAVLDAAARIAAAEAEESMRSELAVVRADTVNFARVSAAMGLYLGRMRSPAANLDGPGRKSSYLIFHQIHLMLNRLGVSPFEESVVSLLAAQDAPSGDLILP